MTSGVTGAAARAAGTLPLGHQRRQVWGGQEGLGGGGTCAYRGTPPGCHQSTARPPGEWGRGGAGRRPSGFHFKPQSSERSKNGGSVPATAGRSCQAALRNERPTRLAHQLRCPPLPAQARGSRAAGGRGVASDVASRVQSPPPSRPVYKASPGVRTRTSGRRLGLECLDVAGARRLGPART